MTKEIQTAVRVRNLRKSFGSLQIIDDVDFEVGAGQILVLLGPSGCGKTTTLRCIAGLEDPDSGTIEIEGRDIVGRNGSLPAEERDLGMVFQSYALWPHMSVRDNVNYGLRIKRVDKADIRRRTDRVLELVGLANHADRLPGQLSGGQQQRVALARSLVGEPAVMLLDEPLSNLDAKLRERMRIELRRIIKELSITAIHVTHDQAEALAIADQVAVMEKGRIVQMDTPREIYARPRTHFVAEFLGSVNTLSPALARSMTGSLVFADGASLGLRSECIRLGDDGGPSGTIAQKTFVGPVTLYDIEVDGGKLVAQSDIDIPVGTRIGLRAAESDVIRFA